MTKATAYFLTQLRDHLDKDPVANRRDLKKLHVKMTDGRKLHKTNLSRHLALTITPGMDTGLVYLRYAQLNGIIEAGTKEQGLFLYVSTNTRPSARTNPGKKP